MFAFTNFLIYDIIYIAYKFGRDAAQAHIAPAPQPHRACRRIRVGARPCFTMKGKKP